MSKVAQKLSGVWCFPVFFQGALWTLAKSTTENIIIIITILAIVGWTNGWTQEFTNGQADGWTDMPILGFSVLEDSVTASKHIFRDQESQNTSESNFAAKKN